MKKILSVLLCVCLTLCGLFLCPASAADEPVYLKGDANADGQITVEDARIVMRASIGLDKAPAAGSAAFKRMKLTGSLVNEITMEDARMTLRAAIGLGDYTNCYTAAELTELFNTLANRVKTPGFMTTTKMTKLVSSTTSSDVKSYDFGEYTSLIRKMMEEDTSLVMPPETSYPYAGKNRMISTVSVPLTGTAKVSELTAGDVAAIRIDRNQTVNVLSDFPGKVNSTDITALKAINCRNAVKIHIDIVTEKYSVVKTKGAGYRTAMSKIYDVSVLEDAAGYNMTQNDSDGLFDFTLTTACEELTSSGSVDYYFTPDTLMPIAAVYNVSETALVDCGVNITVTEDLTVVPVVGGSIKQNCFVKENAVFIFEKYYVNN